MRNPLRDLDVHVEFNLGVMGMAAFAATVVVSTGMLLRRCLRLQRHRQRTARYRAKIALGRRDARLKAPDPVERYLENIRSAAAPVLACTAAGSITAASTALIELFGYESEAALRQIPMPELYVNPADWPPDTAAARSGRSHLFKGECRMRYRDHREIRVLTNWRMADIGEGTSGYEGYLIDITELHEAVEQRQRLESQLHLARKLELIG